MERVNLNMVLEDDVRSTQAPLSDRLDARIQISDEMPTLNSEDITDHDLHPDNPLLTSGNENVSQPEGTAEPYVPWFGDTSQQGIIPRFYLLHSRLGIQVLWLLIMLWAGACIFALDGPISYLVPLDTWIRVVHSGLFALSGVINWVPAMCVYEFLLLNPNLSKMRTRIVIVIGATFFGLLLWPYYALVSKTNFPYWKGPLNFDIRHSLQTWSTGTVPQSFRGCDARVESQQWSLFLPDTYNTQFARTVSVYENSTMRLDYYPAFNMELFHSIQMSQTLCGQGFMGNTDLYGLGIRTGLYLQWISALFANNLLPDTRQELQKIYLIFSLAICLATIIASLAKTCTFSIEIEIMYWMYLGGYICVFGTAPCSIKLGSEMKWIKIDWRIVLLFTTHALMYYHVVWFIWHAYDRVFSRMPCGTYHFFLVPLLDPSEVFWVLRDCLNHLLIPLIPLLSLFPFIGLLLISEIKHAIQDFATYQLFFQRAAMSDSDQAESTEPNDTSVKKSIRSRLYRSIKWIYMKFRVLCELPSRGRGGIRLVTPIDVKKRRFVGLIHLRT